MSTLRFVHRTMPAVNLNGESSLPSVANIQNVQQRTRACLGEDDGLFIGYGYVANAFPYRQQDRYGRRLRETQLPVAELENPYLKAVFAPGLGGRLLSLFDKEAGRELLFANPVFRPGNLAVRNAWFSGGVEWNMGVVGHGPYTAAPLFTARLALPDGTPVLRMYQFERIRQATYQMDFFLPEDSRLLYARMRLVNPRTETIPMYWWSNIAVPERPDGRVVAAADEAYTYRDDQVCRVPIPENGGTDVTYPVHNRAAVDFFFRVPDEAPKFIAQVDAAGYGLLQASTRRLKGRKLFVWGQGRGGSRWQEFLSDGRPGGGRYIELQAGLARTQYECLPMPPQTAWEWLEVYGAVRADPERVHGGWAGAKAELEEQVARRMPAGGLENLLAETRRTIALRPAELVSAGEGWGALEELRRRAAGEAPLSGHLDFGSIGPEQEPWKRLLDSGSLGAADPSRPPVSWMGQRAFADKLEEALEGADRGSWYAWLQHGVICLQQRRFDRAREALEKSLALRENAWALYGLAALAEARGQAAPAGPLAARAARLLPEDLSLAREALRLLCRGKQEPQALELLEAMPRALRADGRIVYYQAYALAHTGRPAEALELLTADGGLEVSDMRESETSLSDLWRTVKAALAGTDDEAGEVPYRLDFRMNPTE